MINQQQKFSMQKFTTWHHFQVKTGFIIGHLKNFIRENPDQWLDREIYILQKILAIQYSCHTHVSNASVQ